MSITWNYHHKVITNQFFLYRGSLRCTSVWFGISCGCGNIRVLLELEEELPGWPSVVVFWNGGGAEICNALSWFQATTRSEENLSQVCTKFNIRTSRCNRIAREAFCKLQLSLDGDGCCTASQELLRSWEKRRKYILENLLFIFTDFSLHCLTVDIVILRIVCNFCRF